VQLNPKRKLMPYQKNNRMGLLKSTKCESFINREKYM